MDGVHKSDSDDGGHTPEDEVEVNEPLELDKYRFGGKWRYTLHDPVTHRTVRVDPETVDAFVDVEAWR